MTALRFAVLGSGSRGNATVISYGSTTLLIDCGFGLRESESRLARLGIDIAELSGIVVTHEHGDHIRGVGPISRRHGIPVWMTPGTHRQNLQARYAELHQFDPHGGFSIRDLDVTPVTVPHDAREPCQFVIGNGDARIGVLSDAGHVTPHICQQLTGVDALLIEANHDTDMLASGPYPPSLKVRVGGDLGHLSNVQTANLLSQIDTTALRHIVLTHLSEQNNTPAHARRSVSAVLGCADDWIGVAEQDAGLAWRSV